MANSETAIVVSKKRKRDDHARSSKTRNSKVSKSEGPQDVDDGHHILLLEEQIISDPDASEEHLDKLLKACKSQNDNASVAVIALCRTFCKLLAAGELNKAVRPHTKDEHTQQRLRTQHAKYVSILLRWLGSSDETQQSTGLVLLMRLVKQETMQEGQRGCNAWTKGTFPQVVKTITVHSALESVISDFTGQFVESYDDIRYYTFQAIADLTSNGSSQDYTDGCVRLLLKVENIPTGIDQLAEWYGQAPNNSKKGLRSIDAHRKQAEKAWTSILANGPSKTSRKAVLAAFNETIVPWFSQPERLMDFLTDEYNEGGATSLLALAGLFHLMQTKNLDYPQFFPKLYSLLDDNLLHSKHRSRFFRLLHEFMASTHLPSALVASFIKRLSRLSLHSPPAGIIAVIPWIYNMLKRHPTCTFMIHREVRSPALRKDIEEHGLEDCFDMSEADPMKTGAIDSCLWEIETLQGHYHPNVATLAKVISEQFTKRSYNLEDFLDHTYQGLVDSELAKEVKKVPVTEFEIPKRILTSEDGGLDRLGGFLSQAIVVDAIRA